MCPFDDLDSGLGLDLGDDGVLVRAVLREAGIIECSRMGSQMLYSLRVPCVLNFFGCVEAVLRAKAEEQLRLVADATRR